MDGALPTSPKPDRRPRQLRRSHASGLKPTEPVDLIHSMECLQYLQEPLRFLPLTTNGCAPGRAVIEWTLPENPPAMNGTVAQVHMALLSIEEWTEG